jgi:hypothetical protein
MKISPTHLFEHLYMHQPQMLVVERALGLEAERVQVRGEEPAVGPGAGPRDASPAALAVLKECCNSPDRVFLF